MCAELGEYLKRCWESEERALRAVPCGLVKIVRSMPSETYEKYKDKIGGVIDAAEKWQKEVESIQGVFAKQALPPKSLISPNFNDLI